MKTSEQIVLLTGGAGAVGHHLIKALLPKVSKVLVLDRDARAFDGIVAEYPDVSCYECDLTHYEEVCETIAAIYEDYQVSVLINNAGTIHSEPLINLLDADNKKHRVENWRTTIDNNLNSMFYVTSCVAEKMVESRIQGLIINVSSISACGNAGQSAYGAAKAAVNSLTATWSKELGMFGIRSAAIAPGFLDTKSTHTALTEQTLRKWQKQTPLGRLGKPEEMAGAVLFLIENDFYNGRILELDGGLKF